MSDRDARGCRVRVSFEAEDALVSWWLPVLQPLAGADAVYSVPGLGQFVVCILDEGGETGVVLGAIYTESDRPPVAELDRVHVRMEDGATFEYDRKAHRLAVDLPENGGHIAITTGGDVTVTVPAGAAVYIGGASEAQRLATEAWVRDVFNTHTHPTGVGPSGPPVPNPAALLWPNITRKTRGE